MNNRILNWKEHVLLRPDAHIGSNDIVLSKLFVVTNNKIVLVSTKVNEALFNCIREIVYNALDHKWRSKRDTLIKITIQDRVITVENSGDPISLEKTVFKHKNTDTGYEEIYELYYPEAYFGRYWTGSNYDDKNDIKTSGKNGMGSKIVNLLSKSFYVECCDGIQVFTQLFENNCKVVSTPEIKPLVSDPYVLIRFEPDYDYFKWCNLELITSYLNKLCYDCSFVSKSSVSFNKHMINVTTLEEYLDLYDIKLINPLALEQDGLMITFGEIPKGCVQNISFVNGMFMTSGEHIRHIRSTLLKTLCDYLNTKLEVPEDNKLTSRAISSGFFLYVSLFKKGLNYSSQTKESLKTHITFDFSITKHYESIIKTWKIFASIEDLVLAKIKKNFNPYTYVKVEDANLAGSIRSKECTLFITEGLSAKAFAIEGISFLEGRDFYGVFPLKGKLLNVMKASHMRVIANKEIIALQLILGIERGLDYRTLQNQRTLKYGKIDILTDNDSDGKHIKGLVINFFKFFNDSLFDIGFIQCTNTPIIRIITGTNFVNLYSMREIVKKSGQRIVYYKGLGSHSSGLEVEDCFRCRIITKFHLTQECKEVFYIIFATGYESTRRDLIIESIKSPKLREPKDTCSCGEFLKTEVVDFQKEVLRRNIPDFFDGLKEAQRKVLFTLLSLPRREVNVAKLAGIVSNKTNYHHGTDPLESVIINLAQSFCGSNNIPLLLPLGQFGTRNENGKDCSAGRYLSVKLNEFYRKLYVEEDILEYNVEEGEEVEPVRYYPPIPYYLLNGCNNLSPGFRTFIPSYKLSDIVQDIRNIISNSPRTPLVPYYEGYLGKVELMDATSYKMNGICITNPKGMTSVIEIPIVHSFSDYKLFLKELERNKSITQLKDYSTNKELKIQFKNLSLDIDDLRLSKVFHLNNIVVMKDGIPLYFKTIEDLIHQFVIDYLLILEKRKKCNLDHLKHHIDVIEQELRFIKDVRSGKIDIKQEKALVIKQLKVLSYIDLGDNFKHLTSLHISSIFKDNYENKKLIIENDKKQLDILNTTTPSDMYLKELSF